MESVQQQLSLRIRPLVVMERSVIDKACAALDATDTATELMNTLRRRCAAFNGNFLLFGGSSKL